MRDVPASVSGAAGCVLLSFATLLPAPASAQVGVDIGLKLVASGFSQPVAVRHAGDGSGRIFIVEQAGRIWIWDGSQVLPTEFLDISTRVLSGGEQGLLGLDFHPNYEANGVFYVSYNREPDGDTRVSRFSVSADSNVADPGSEVVLLTVNQPQTNHNGGDIHFGPDGYLYVMRGDGGGAGDPGNNAQDLTSLLGKLLRIDVSPSGSYTIPPSNPFVGVAGDDHIWAYGLRNPWRFSFDRATGDLYIGDVGQSQREEIDFQAQGSAGGQNYGWPCREGDVAFDPGRPGCGGPYVEPILTYGHGLGCAVTGGYRYRGPIASLQGTYVYGDYCSGRIWFATRDGGGNWSSAIWQDTDLSISSFGEDEAGEVYVVDHNGAIHRFVTRYDYGDAPDPGYPTLQASNGARHDGGGPFLGAQVDRESDGLPSASANGDDNNSSDDEDGVVFTTPLVPGEVANLNVTASASGFLDAWLDYNQDQDWSDGGEAIFTSQPLASGANAFAIGVPVGAAPGLTFARFRFSTAGGLAFDGLAVDGEVEDHQVQIQAQVSIGDATLAEGDAGTTQAQLGVTLSAASTATISVPYATANGSAAAPSDYASRSGTLTFAPGETTKTISVPVVGDRIAEASETFFVNLTAPNGAVIADAQGLVTITNDDAPGALQFATPTYSVGEAGPSITLIVTRTGGTAGGVTVDYATANGSAAAGSDYAATSGTLSFGVDVTSLSFTVPIRNDTLDESDEDFTVTLSNPTAGATLGSPAGASVTITDNDAAGFLSFSAAAYAVSETGVKATIGVKRSGGAASGVSVLYATANGSAEAGPDYTATSGTLSFGAGVSSLTFSVPIASDTVIEGGESVLLELSSPGGGATLGLPSTALLTITDNDLGGAIRFSAASYSVNESLASATITATRTGGTGGPVTVDYQTSGGTATPGSDYTTASGPLTFAAGQTSRTFTVPITPDTDDEDNESVGLTLSAPSPGATLGSPSSATLTIADNDTSGSVQFSLSAYTVDETGGVATITATRSGGSAGPVTVDYQTADGSATAGSDYTTASGTLTFGSGVLSQSFSVPIANDGSVEGPESVDLTLSNPTGRLALGARKTAVLTITDDEPGVTLHFSAPGYTVTEGSPATLTVKRSGPTASALTVDYQTNDGSALAGSDYTAALGTLSFKAGISSLTFKLTTTADSQDESDEDLTLTLGNPTGGASLGTQATATLKILDNDAGGALKFSAAAYSRSEGLPTATITVSRSGGLASGVTVNYASSDGTAQAGLDYTTTSGTLSFTSGQTSRTFTLPILPDDLDEDNESLTLTLSSPTAGATLGSPATATLSITDDDTDGVFQFSLSGYTGSEGGGPATVMVTRSGGKAGPVTVDYQTSNGTAQAGSDYTAAAGTLTFNTGILSQTFAVTLADDGAIEGSETLNLALSNPSGRATLGTRSTALLTIADNDGVTLHFSAPTYSVTEGGSAVVTVKRSGSTATAVSVQYTSSDGSATTADSDYTAKSGTLSFKAGQSSLTFTLATTADTRDESNEDVNLALSNPTGGAFLGTQSSATLTLVDNDAGGALKFGAASYSKTEAGPTATITVTRTGGVASGVTVSYASTDGTAQAGLDYTAVSGTLSFAAGQASRTFTVTLANDTLDELNETLSLDLSAPAGGATLGSPATTTLTILDNDVAGSVQFSGASYSVGESDGTLTVTLTRSGGAASGVTLNYATSNGTATAGADYTAASGTLTFGANETTKSFAVTITQDGSAEANETVALTLSAPGGGATLGSPSTATLYVIDDE